MPSSWSSLQGAVDPNLRNKLRTRSHVRSRNRRPAIAVWNSQRTGDSWHSPRSKVSLPIIRRCCQYSSKNEKYRRVQLHSSIAKHSRFVDYGSQGQLAETKRGNCGIQREGTYANLLGRGIPGSFANWPWWQDWVIGRLEHRCLGKTHSSNHRPQKSLQQERTELSEEYSDTHCSNTHF